MSKILERFLRIRTASKRRSLPSSEVINDRGSLTVLLIKSVIYIPFPLWYNDLMVEGNEAAKRNDETQTGVKRATIETYGPAPDARPRRGFHSMLCRVSFHGDWDEGSIREHLKQVRERIIPHWMFVGGWMPVPGQFHTHELYYYDDSGD
jgi:hypothetical protein